MCVDDNVIDPIDLLLNDKSTEPWRYWYRARGTSPELSYVAQRLLRLTCSASATGQDLATSLMLGAMVSGWRQRVTGESSHVHKDTAKGRR